MPTSLDPARPGTVAVTASRPRRALIALGLTAALTGGVLVAQTQQAPHASAATATPSTTYSVSRHSVAKKPGATKARYTVTASKNGSRIAGSATLIMNGKRQYSARLVHGKFTFTPGLWRYRVGTNTVRVVVHPARAALADKSTKTVRVTATKPLTARQKLVKVAKAQVGDRYAYGASGPSSFDCSGLTSYVYKKAVGKSLPRSSSAQKAAGKVVSRKNARPGDIIWTPGHVSIYVGNGQQVEAARPGVGVVKRHIWQDSPRFIRI
ncbi:C40 family peptidase [Isoptericola sp. NPDC057653]|uniref:C40 family peptidase n=1 Tax=Isoptericola sp. NPDC057653 TaxID=3346195 RepID=UPI0036AB0D43